MTSPEPDDDWTEASDADFDRVDLVGKAANGTQFLIAKAKADRNAGLLKPAFVRDLITKQENAMTEQVTKADPDLDASTVLAEPDSNNAPGSPTDPGSPAWEQVDAATAQKWTAILSRAKNALTVMSDREMQEADTGGDSDDLDNAFDLDDAGSAIDYAISVLAPFAVGEQAEADQGAMELVGKSVTGLDPAVLDTVEGLAPVMKSGRTLSASNEQAIRGAVDSLQKVLASLPPAPAETEPAVKTADEPAVKAKSDPLVAVYTADGKLLGAIASADLTPLSTGTPADSTPDGSDTSGGNPDDPATGDDPSGNDVTPDVPTPPATQPAAAPAETVIPGTATVQAPPDDQKVTKTAFTAALEEVLTPIAKQLEQHAELAEMVKGLKERVDAFGRRPDDRNSPLVNGSTGTPGVTAREGHTDELAALRKAVDEAEPARKRDAQQQLVAAEIKARFQR